MKKSNKKALQSRGITLAGRAIPTPGAQAHADKRKANRKTQKQRLKIELRSETARASGPFDKFNDQILALLYTPRLLFQRS